MLFAYNSSQFGFFSRWTERLRDCLTHSPSTAVEDLCVFGRTPRHRDDGGGGKFLKWSKRRAEAHEAGRLKGNTKANREGEGKAKHNEADAAQKWMDGKAGRGKGWAEDGRDPVGWLRRVVALRSHRQHDLRGDGRPAETVCGSERREAEAAQIVWWPWRVVCVRAWRQHIDCAETRGAVGRARIEITKGELCWGTRRKAAAAAASGRKGEVIEEE